MSTNASLGLQEMFVEIAPLNWFLARLRYWIDESENREFGMGPTSLLEETSNLSSLLNFLKLGGISNLRELLLNVMETRL